MPAATALEVFAAARHAGVLYRSDVAEDTFLFSYAPDARPQDAVSLTMPVVRDPYDAMGGLLPIFEMNLPEGALLEKLRRLFAKAVPQLDDLALLSIVGQSQIGRLRHAPSGGAPAEVPAQNLREILTYEGAEDLFTDLMQRYASHSGISGVQPKVLLRAEETAPVRLAHRGATHLIKSFDAREYPELAANEFFCMEAARHAGIPTPGMELSHNRRILAIERFDLRPDGAYLGVEDFCVLSGLRAHGRYQGSYETVAKRIGEFVSPPRRREALEQLFMMLALSSAMENGDAHLKNFAVVYEHPESEVRLAPAYDLLSTTPYVRRDILALTFAGSKRFPARKQLIAFARQACNLSEPTAGKLLERVAAGVAHAIAMIRRYTKEHADFSKPGEHFIATFERGLARLAA